MLRIEIGASLYNSRNERDPDGNDYELNSTNLDVFLYRFGVGHDI